MSVAARSVAAPSPLNSLGLPKAPQDTRVVVAMSGGVDSSVVAAMLAREGYDVVGLTMQLYDHGAAVHRKGACCAGQDIHDARDVAARLGVPHYVLDYEAAVSREGDRAVRARLCRRRDADPLRRLQPAHEVRRPVRGRATISAPICSRPAIMWSATTTARAAGRSIAPPIPMRDQSYFLFATTREQLRRLRFPLGGLPKPEVRALAREFGLDVADKADSQDICFVPTGHYSEMIERLMPGAAEPGDIVHVDGRVLGRHTGILHYTIGQRRGLGVAAGEPLYVVALDAARKRVVVGPREALATPLVQLARLQLDRPRRARRLPHKGLKVARARALDAAAGAGPSVRRWPRRLRRAGVRRFAGPGLRALRIRPTRTRACSAAASSRRRRSGLRRRRWRRSTKRRCSGRRTQRPRPRMRSAKTSMRSPRRSSPSASIAAARDRAAGGGDQGAGGDARAADAFFKT